MPNTLEEIQGLSKELYKSVSSVIETITFLPVEKPEDVEDKPEKYDENINGSVFVKTDNAVYLVELIVPRFFLEVISDELTIADNATTPEDINSILVDILLELVNNVAGSLMRKTEELTGIFTLEIPQYAADKPLNDKAFIRQKYIVGNKYWISSAITKI